MTQRKLLFTVCCTCAKDNNQESSCNHDRASSGVCVTVALNKALELGYKVRKIIEVWHLKERGDSIFVKYIYIFLKGRRRQDQGQPCQETSHQI